MQQASIQAFSFDLDGTLLDGNGLQQVIARTCELLAKRLPSLNSRALAEANDRIWPGYWQEVEQKWTLGALDGASVVLEVWRRTLKACDCQDESTAKLAANLMSRLGRQSMRLFDDARDVVLALKRDGIPLALITNGASDTQREALQVLGIEDWFDAIVISGEHGSAKPDPLVFQLASKGLRTAAENTSHVGDELPTDIAGARAAGYTAVWLNRSGRIRNQSDPEPHIEIASLAMLKGRVPA